MMMMMIDRLQRSHGLF